MDFYDEKKEQRKSKAPTVVRVCIIALIAVIIVIIASIMYLKNSIIHIYIDGQKNVDLEKILYIEQTEEGTQLYLPIIKMAEFLNYKGYNGDYKNKSEDKNKCHVVCENETAMFTLESDVLVKISNNSEKEFVKIDKQVFELNEELYTTEEGIEKAFNILIEHDEKFKNIQIYSMNYLVEYYATKLQVEDYSTNFSDQKAIFDDMLIIQENGKYGVWDLKDQKALLQAKYEDIKYLPSTSEFLVKSNGKYGIMTKEAVTKIKIQCDEIKIMDNQLGLYLIKQNNFYGVMDFDGKVKIVPEYKQIGINNITYYAENGIENQYVLLDELIPVKNQDNLWGFFNIKGEKIIDFKYTNVGAQTESGNNTYPAIVIPSYKLIVVQANKNYNLITLNGEEIITGNILDAVYIKTDVETGKNEFFMTTSNNTKVTNIEKWLEKNGQ